METAHQKVPFWNQEARKQSWAMHQESSMSHPRYFHRPWPQNKEEWIFTFQNGTALVCINPKCSHLPLSLGAPWPTHGDTPNTPPDQECLLLEDSVPFLLWQLHSSYGFQVGKWHHHSYCQYSVPGRDTWKFRHSYRNHNPSCVLLGNVACRDTFIIVERNF